jgi:hypothetical protein
MCPVIYNPDSCVMCAVIHLLNAKNMIAVEIQCELCADYGQIKMSEGTVDNSVKCSKMGEQMFTMESGHPSVVSDDLVQSVAQIICER